MMYVGWNFCEEREEREGAGKEAKIEMGGFDVRDWLDPATGWIDGHIARRTDGKNETNEVPHKLARANRSRTAKTIATTKICDELMPTGACICPYISN